MKFRSLVVGCVATLLVAFVVQAQSTRPEPAPATPQARPQQAAPPSTAPGSTPPAAPARPVARQASTAPTGPAMTTDAQKAFLNQYCMACHSEKMKAAGLDSARRLTMDSLDPANVDKDRDKWELVVRKVRAGQMPPLGMKRPDPADFDAMITS